MPLPSYPGPIKLSQIRDEWGLDTVITRTPAAGSYYDVNYKWEIEEFTTGGAEPESYYDLNVFWAGEIVYAESFSFLPNLTSVTVGSNTYYRGSYVANNEASVGYPTGGAAVSIPSAGPIKFSNFLGSQRYQVYIYALSGFDINLNILAAAQAAGFINQVGQPPLRAIIHINPGAVLGSGSRLSLALDTGTGYARTPNITVDNYGYITGAGGSDGLNYATGTGGPAVRLQTGVRFRNYGIVQGGGGSGQAGNNGMFGGGSGYFAGAGVLGAGLDTGPSSGTLDSGGGWQNDDGKQGNANGGGGGGWVSTWNGSVGTTSQDGYGMGASVNSPGIPGGWSPPGTAYYGWNSYALTGSIIGTYRGWVDQDPPGPPP